MLQFPPTGVTTISITTANGVSGVVANPTTTPAITITLGNITPTDVIAIGTPRVFGEVRPANYLTQNGAYAFQWAEHANVGTTCGVGKRDDVYSQGWNINGESPGANSTYLNFESCYSPGGGVQQSEVYFGVDNGAGFATRPFGFIHDIVSNAVTFQFSSSSVLFSSTASANPGFSVSTPVGGPPTLRSYVSTLQTDVPGGSNFIVDGSNNSLLRLESTANTVGVGTSSGMNVKLGGSIGSNTNVGGNLIVAANGSIAGTVTMSGYNPTRVLFVDTAGLVNDSPGLIYQKATGTLLPTIIRPTAMVAGGTKFTTSGCSVSATTGGSMAGTYTSGTTGTCTVTITLNGATGVTAPNGWVCFADNISTPANLQTPGTTTTTTIVFSGTTVSGDVIRFSCPTGY